MTPEPDAWQRISDRRRPEQEPEWLVYGPITHDPTPEPLVCVDCHDHPAMQEFERCARCETEDRAGDAAWDSHQDFDFQHGSNS